MAVIHCVYTQLCGLVFHLDALKLVFMQVSGSWLETMNHKRECYLLLEEHDLIPNNMSPASNEAWVRGCVILLLSFTAIHPHVAIFSHVAG